MERWQDYNIDPSTIPDEVLKSERGRRNAARRTEYKGGPKGIPTKCPSCGKLCRSGRRAALHCADSRV